MIHTIKILADSLDLSSLPHAQATNAKLATVLNIVFGITGALSLLMVVIGGLRYTASVGDPQRAAQARNTIIYALIGLAITISGFAIVGFVIGATG